MTRGLNREESIKLLVDGFFKRCNRVIKSVTIKDFINNKLKINAHEIKRYQIRISNS